MRLAVFDLDGTITRHDTLVLYALGYVVRRPWRLPRLLLVLPAVLAYGLGLSDRGGLKAALIRWALGGTRRAELAAWTDRFVKNLIAHGTFTDARAAIESHRRAGDRLVLMSASPDLYVPAIASALGFHESICTGIAWRDDRLLGHLTTPNRHGEEKAKCLRELKAHHPVEIVAYGNAASDLAHLRLVEHGLLVNGSRSARRAARGLEIACTEWR